MYEEDQLGSNNPAETTEDSREGGEGSNTCNNDVCNYIDEPMEEGMEIQKAPLSQSDSRDTATPTTQSYTSATSVTEKPRKKTLTVRNKTAKKTQLKKIKKVVARQRFPSDRTFTKAVKTFAGNKMRMLFLNPMMLWPSLTDRSATERRLQACQVCGQSSCLEDCLECGKKSCPVRSKQLKMVIANLTANPATRDVKLQKGSRAAFLSPLCMSTSEPHEEQACDKNNKFTEISPEMIVESLDMLEKIRLYPTTETVLKFMQSRYTLNPNQEALRKELSDKLEAAASIGLLECFVENTWRLANIRQQATMSKDQVSAFWEMYLNSITPLRPLRRPPRKDEGSDPPAPGSKTPKQPFKCAFSDFV